MKFGPNGARDIDKIGELEDVNGDGKIDIVAINPTQAAWFESPSWKKHIMMDGRTKKDNVCIALNDIDGDGRIDVALGAEWMPTNTESGGTLQWLRQPENLQQAWSLFPIGSEPTLMSLATGEALACINYLLHRGEAVVDRLENGVAWYRAA